MSEEIQQYHVAITAHARSDLKDIVSVISQDSPRTALKILEKIESKIHTLDHFPYRGGYIPELLKRNIKDYRQLIESPWRIIYRIDDDMVNVLMVIDSRRNTQDILLEKLIK